MSKITVMPQTARFTTAFTIDQTTLGYQVTYGLAPKEEGGEPEQSVGEATARDSLDDPKNCSD